MGLSLKKFIKYFDDMTELNIMTFPNINDDEDEGITLFKGHVFDPGADIILKHLYSKGYVLERNDEGMAIMIFPYKNEYGANLATCQVNVIKKKDLKKRKKGKK